MVEEEEYDDFLKEDDSPGDSKDSFGKKIQDMYEEHKKKDTKIIHRPISSYQPNSSNNNNNYNLISNQLGNNSNNSNKISHPKSASSKNTDLPKKSFDEIMNDLKNFIKKNKISKNDFIENDNIFLNFEDFKSCLQSIHYNIPNTYAKVLFIHDNEEGAKDNYIFIKKFLKLIYPESDFDSSYNSHSVYNSQKTDSIYNNNNNNSNNNNNNNNYNNNNNKNIKSNNKNNNNNISNITNSSISKSSINNNNSKNKNESISLYEIKYINEEYNQFNKDISNILKNDGKITKKNSINRPTSSYSTNNKFNNKRLKSEKPQKNYTYKYTIDSNDNNNNNNDNKLNTINNQEQISENNNNNDNNMNKDNKNTNNKESSEFFIKKYNKQRIKEEKKEYEKINKQFIKREEDFTKDCILKSFECNKICKELNIDMKYSIEYIDDELKCIVESKNRKKYIPLKEFIVEYRRLNKKYLNKDVEERYMGKEEEKKKDVEAILKERENEKNEKLKDIKEVLIEAVRLKTKLKNQLNNLKSNIKLDEKIVIEHLVKAGINFPEYNQEYNEEMNKNDNNNDDNNNENNKDDNNNKIN